MSALLPTIVRNEPRERLKEPHGVSATIVCLGYVERLSSRRCHTVPYRVDIKNNSGHKIRIGERRFTVKGHNTSTRNIRRTGVVGLSPIIAPGETFSYCSAMPWPELEMTIAGKISYQTLGDDGKVSQGHKFANINETSFHVAVESAVKHDRPLSPEHAVMLGELLRLYNENVNADKPDFFDTSKIGADLEARSAIEHFFLNSWLNLPLNRGGTSELDDWSKDSKGHRTLRFWEWPNRTSIAFSRNYGIPQGIVCDDFFAKNYIDFTSFRDAVKYDHLHICCVIDYRRAYSSYMQNPDAQFENDIHAVLRTHKKSWLDLRHMLSREGFILSPAPAASIDLASLPGPANYSVSTAPLQENRIKLESFLENIPAILQRENTSWDDTIPRELYKKAKSIVNTYNHKKKKGQIFSEKALSIMREARNLAAAYERQQRALGKASGVQHG